jgi:hypothetical protein
MTIQLYGLTTEQVEMCERLWSLETEEDLDRYLARLDAAAKRMASTLIDLMIQESAEEQLEAMDRYPDAEMLLSKIK